jgi:hypothetical protein
MGQSQLSSCDVVLREIHAKALASESGRYNGSQGKVEIALRPSNFEMKLFVRIHEW